MCLIPHIRIQHLKFFYVLVYVYYLFDNYIKNIPEWSWDDVIKNSLSSINNTLDKLEPFYIEKYKSHKRDIKIVDILKD